MRTSKVRLDELLVQRRLAESLPAAQSLLLAGRVKAPGVKILKPGSTVSPDQVLEVTPGRKYVSRGGEKLEGALDAFRVNLSGRDCLDVGASTGGFTDCLLQRGALKVFAVDVGSGQLDWTLRNDPRVVSRENTHILRFQKTDLPFSPSLVTIDVSFISLEKILPHLASLVDPGAEFVALVKPQFEVEPKLAPKGVVRDPSVRQAVVRKVSDFLPAWGFSKRGECPSPIQGPEGNVEFFLHFVREDR